MRKITTLFAVLFIALSANAQLVVEKRAIPFGPPWYSSHISVLSFNGPSLFDSQNPYYDNLMTKPHITWYGSSHVWACQGVSGGIQFLELSIDPVIHNGVMLGASGNRIHFAHWRGTTQVTNDIVAYTIYAQGNIYNYSDMAAKTNIVPVSSALKTILALKPVTYQWRDNSMSKRAVRATTNPKEIGFIAQDVEKILPDIVAIDDGKKLVNYQAIIPILTAAIQELNERIVALENQLKAK